MNVLFNIIAIVQVVSAVAIIGLVLLQHGKGADMGAAFGSGASGSLFGATGSSNFLSKSTGIAAAIFFAATLALSYSANKRNGGTGVMDNLPVAAAPAPASGSSASSTASAPAQASKAASVPSSNQIPK